MAKQVAAGMPYERCAALFGFNLTEETQAADTHLFVQVMASNQVVQERGRQVLRVKGRTIGVLDLDADGNLVEVPRDKWRPEEVADLPEKVNENG